MRAGKDTKADGSLRNRSVRRTNDTRNLEERPGDCAADIDLEIGQQSYPFDS